MKRPSIRDRLLIWTTLVITLIMGFAGSLLYQSVKRSIYSQHDQLLNEAATLVLREVKIQNGEVYHAWKESFGSSDSSPRDSLIQVWDQKSGETIRSAALGDHDLEKQFGELQERVFYDVILPSGEPGRAVGILTLPTVGKGEGGFPPENHPQVFVWADRTEELQDVLIKTKRAFVAAGFAVILLSSVAIWLIIHLSARAMKSISRDLLAREGTEIGQPIPVPDSLPSEVAGMALKFNALLARIDHFRGKDQDFFLNVAHEVRTPLAGIKAVIEQALRKPREVEDYQSRLSRALEPTEKLARLVDRLMEFGHIRHARESMKRSRVDWSDLLASVASDFQSIATERGLRFEYDDEKGVLCHADGDLLKIVVTNLVENAVNYAAPNTVVRLSASIDTEGGSEFKILNEVSDDSDLPDDLDIMFDAFYRNDQSRDISANHIGIGLSFCEEIMAVVGGEITVSRPSPRCVCFSVRMTS